MREMERALLRAAPLGVWSIWIPVEWYRLVFTHIDRGVTEFRNEAFTGIEELLLASGALEFRNEAFIQELLFLKKMFS